jgi:hypothetical protein
MIGPGKAPMPCEPDSLDRKRALALWFLVFSLSGAPCFGAASRCRHRNGIAGERRACRLVAEARPARWPRTGRVPRAAPRSYNRPARGGSRSARPLPGEARPGAAGRGTPVFSGATQRNGIYQRLARDGFGQQHLPERLCP